MEIVYVLLNVSTGLIEGGVCGGEPPSLPRPSPNHSFDGGRSKSDVRVKDVSLCVYLCMCVCVCVCVME